MPVRQVPAVREVHPEDGVPGLQDRHVHGPVRLRPRVRLNVGVLGAEELLHALDRQRLDLVVVVVGSVVVFTLFLFVISRWTASATSYSMLLMPLVAVVVAALRLGEPITPAVVAGGALVLIGVYLGAFAPSLARPLPGLTKRVPRKKW